MVAYWNIINQKLKNQCVKYTILYSFWWNQNYFSCISKRENFDFRMEKNLQSDSAVLNREASILTKFFSYTSIFYFLNFVKTHIIHYQKIGTHKIYFFVNEFFYIYLLIVLSWILYATTQSFPIKHNKPVFLHRFGGII